MPSALHTVDTVNRKRPAWLFCSNRRALLFLNQNAFGASSLGRGKSVDKLNALAY
jgi:hypothetical protein